MKKKLLKILLVVYITILVIAIIFFVSWKIELNRHSNMTEKYGYEFESFDIHKNKSKIKLLSVIDYSSSHARVYYLFENQNEGKIINFVKENDKWKIEKQEHFFQLP